MSDRLTAEPGTLEFLRQLLQIAQGSDHPMDKALTRVLSKQIGETEAVRSFDPSTEFILSKVEGLRAGSTQGKPGSPQAVRPFDRAQDRPFDGAQGGRGSPQEQDGDNGS